MIAGVTYKRAIGRHASGSSATGRMSVHTASLTVQAVMAPFACSEGASYFTADTVFVTGGLR